MNIFKITYLILNYIKVFIFINIDKTINYNYKFKLSKTNYNLI